MATETQLIRGNGAGQVIITPPAPAALTPANYSEAERLAAAMHKSGMFGVKSAEQAMVVLMTGMELGFSPAQAFRGIHVINNKPTLSADMMVATCKSRPDVCEYFRLVESNDDHAVYETQRVGESEPTANEFTMADAKRAGLLTNPTWQKFPPQMLRARASSGLARAVYPDLILGLYTPDEVEAIEPRREDAHRESVPHAIPVAPARPQLAEPEPTTEDRLKAERLEKAAPLVSLLKTLPQNVRDTYRADWEDKYGTANPLMLNFDVMESEMARIKSEQFGGDETKGETEEDPFAGEPALRVVNAQGTAPGHGD